MPLSVCIFLLIKLTFIISIYIYFIVKNDSPEFIYTAFSQEGEVMALQHKKLAIYGVQFHPESILTEQGHALLQNFLTLPNLSFK